jgi:hypothetical protein
MAFSWENLKSDVRDNSPSSDAVTKSVGTAVIVYASVLAYWHRDIIGAWTKEQWARLTKKSEGEAETGNVNESL